MKLSSHYNKASIIITVIVLIAGGIIYFFTINYIARTQLDNDLGEEIEEVESYVNTYNKLPKQVDFDEDVTIFIKTTQTQLPQRFFDTTYKNPKEEQVEAGRAISGLISVNGEHYKVIITESRESTEYLIQIISLITVTLMVILVLIIFLTNRFILNGLWKPFYKTLAELKSFNPADSHNFTLQESRVDEFNELNGTVQSMTLKVRHDFQHLKQFTENASHEMQTPLAVITSKLDTLIQDESLNGGQFAQIHDIYAATSKLSRLNQSLLLLVKIDNNLIDDIELLRVDVLIEAKLKQFQELIADKQINIETSLTPIEISASKYLVDILLNNLLSNAIRHNIFDGVILINLTQRGLTFANTGATQPLNAEVVFDRFKKDNKSEGSGLGLAIVKNICAINNWAINYQYVDGLHSFIIEF